MPLNVDCCYIVYEEPIRVMSLDYNDIEEPANVQNAAGANPPAVGVNF